MPVSPQQALEVLGDAQKRKLYDEGCVRHCAGGTVRYCACVRHCSCCHVDSAFPHRHNSIMCSSLGLEIQRRK